MVTRCESGSSIFFGIGITSIVLIFIVGYPQTSVLMTPSMRINLNTWNWTLVREKNPPLDEVINPKKPPLDEVISLDLPLCNSTLGEEGRWEYDPESPQAGLRYPVHDDCIINYNYACKHTNSPQFPNDLSHLRPRMTEAMNWVWKPKSCKYARLDGKEFLKRFEGKRFIMLGDSINTEWSHSLKCQLMRSGNIKGIWVKKPEIEKCLLLSNILKVEEHLDRHSPNPKLNDSYFPKSLSGHPTVDTRALQCNEPTAYEVSLPGHKPVTIMSMDARFMGALAAWHDRSFLDGRSRLREWWQTIIDGTNPTHIMINTGMHWTNIPNAVEDMVYLAQNTAVDLRAIFNGTVIFRTSMGNIKMCGDLKEPLSTYDEASEEKYMDYNWGDLEKYNRIWEEAFENVDKFLVLSTRPYGLLPFGRRDGHVDCAHSCLPGPYDTWAGDWLWTILKQVPDSS